MPRPSPHWTRPWTPAPTCPSGSQLSIAFRFAACGSRGVIAACRLAVGAGLPRWRLLGQDGAIVCQGRGRTGDARLAGEWREYMTTTRANSRVGAGGTVHHWTAQSRCVFPHPSHFVILGGIRALGYQGRHNDSDSYQSYRGRMRFQGDLLAQDGSSTFHGCAKRESGRWLLPCRRCLRVPYRTFRLPRPEPPKFDSAGRSRGVWPKLVCTSDSDSAGTHGYLHLYGITRLQQRTTQVLGLRL